MSIWITGDCHSDVRRFSTDNFPEQKIDNMSKENDVIIVLGDFGLVWHRDCEDSYEKNWLNWLEDKPFTVCFVDGNHENHKRLAEYPIVEWNGGRVHKIREHVLHLMRGEIFTIQDKKFFAYGGAASHDIQDGILEMDEDGEWRKTAKQWDKERKMYRIKDLTWWENELPTEEEMQNGINNLEKHNWEVDFVLSHCAPQHVVSTFSHGLYKPDILTMYFNGLHDKGLQFNKWCFGHYHDNRNIMGKYIMLYEQIIRIV